MEGEFPGIDETIIVELDADIFSAEAVLKTCHWYSRDFAFEVSQTTRGFISVSLKPKQSSILSSNIRSEFVAMATDFTLRERIEARTTSIRELLLAKAFAEAGILEDSPEGVFGDRIEEEKPDGLFKILGNA